MSFGCIRCLHCSRIETDMICKSTRCNTLCFPLSTTPGGHPGRPPSWMPAASQVDPTPARTALRPATTSRLNLPSMVTSEHRSSNRYRDIHHPPTRYQRTIDTHCKVHVGIHGYKFIPKKGIECKIIPLVWSISLNKLADLIRVMHCIFALQDRRDCRGDVVNEVQSRGRLPVPTVCSARGGRLPGTDRGVLSEDAARLCGG